MQVKITKAGVKKIQNEIEILKQHIATIRDDKAMAYNNSGDTWHDNPRFNELEREEQLAIKQLMKLEETFLTAQIVEWDKRNTETVQIGSIVLCHCVYSSGEEEEVLFEIVGYGESDPINDKIGYECPVGLVLIGLASGESVECKIPAGKVLYKVLKMYEDWEAVKQM